MLPGLNVGGAQVSVMPQFTPSNTAIDASGIGRGFSQGLGLVEQAQQARRLRDIIAEDQARRPLRDIIAQEQLLQAQQNIGLMPQIGEVRGLEAQRQLGSLRGEIGRQSTTNKVADLAADYALAEAEFNQRIAPTKQNITTATLADTEANLASDLAQGRRGRAAEIEDTLARATLNRASAEYKGANTDLTDAEKKMRAYRRLKAAGDNETAEVLAVDLFGKEKDPAKQIAALSRVPLASGANIQKYIAETRNEDGTVKDEYFDPTTGTGTRSRLGLDILKRDAKPLDPEAEAIIREIESLRSQLGSGQSQAATPTAPTQQPTVGRFKIVEVK